MTDDTYAYWMGYMLSTVKDVAQRTHDRSCVETLRVFCETSSRALPQDHEALSRILNVDLYEGDYSRKVPDTPVLRLAGAFHCDPDPSCGQDGAA